MRISDWSSDVCSSDLVSEIFLEIEAGSSGRPNAAQELANLERVSPLLVQTPGISPRWIATKVLKLVDSNVDLDEAFIDGLPSLTAMNALAGRPATQPGTGQIGRAPCRGRGWQHVESSVVARSLTKKTK